MKWWNGIWLNEAFATFMSVCCLDDFRPEWSRWVHFGTEKDIALQIDGLHATRPIEFPVHAPDEAEAMFDNLTYLKGGNVLRMVEQYLGTERFRDGVRKYLKTHAYANTETTDLWDAIESVTPGEPVRALLDSWIFQGGHPLVTARLEGGEVVLTQEPFVYLPEEARPAGGPSSAIGRDWLVPVCYEDRPGKLTASVLGPSPNGHEPLRLGTPSGLPVANAGGSGTYRLRYEGSLFDQVLANLSSLEPLERFNLVADSFACALAGLSRTEDFLALVRRLRGESDPNVWVVVSGAMRLLDFTAAGLAEGELAALVCEVVRPEARTSRLGARRFGLARRPAQPVDLHRTARRARRRRGSPIESSRRVRAVALGITEGRASRVDRPNRARSRGLLRRARGIRGRPGGLPQGDGPAQPAASPVRIDLCTRRGAR